MQGIAKFLLCKKAVRRAFLIVCVSVTSAGLVGCSSIGLRSPASNGWLESGSLALSRPVPVRAISPNSTATIVASRSVDAPPSTPPGSSDAAQVIVSRQDKTITAIRPGGSPIIIKTEGAQHLPPGSFSVTVKEENPLWYAPAEYFAKRSLQVPEEGSRARFMRAALGNRALYLNNQTPIHSGPVWLQEIGGIRVKQPEMEQLYSLVTVGTRVEVR